MELCLYSYMPARYGIKQLYPFLPYVIFTVHTFRAKRPFHHDSRIKSFIGNISLLMSFNDLYMTMPV
jgi:hypothetical protein